MKMWKSRNSPILGDEDEDEDTDEEIPHTEDWEAPPPETSSDTDDEDIPDGMQCIVCHRSRRVTVKFVSRSHAVFNTCLRRISCSRRRADDHSTTQFPCHSYKTKTCYVNELSLKLGSCGTVESKVHGRQVYTIWNWVPVRRWMSKRSIMVARGLRDKAVLKASARMSCDT